MATEAELKKQRDELDAKLVKMQETGDNNAVAIGEVMRDLAQIRQTQEALNRSALEARMGPQGESLYYQESVEAKEKAQASECYADTGSGCIRMFGHEVQGEDGTAYRVHGLLDDVAPRDEAQARLQRAYADRQFVRQTMRRLKRLGADAPVHTPHADQLVRRAVAEMPSSVRKIFADLANFGADMMPYTVDADFERDLLVSHTLTNSLRQMQHPGGTLDIPIVEGVLQAFVDKIPSGDDPDNARLSSLGTSDGTVKCVDMACGSQVHRSANEQSVVAILPILREEMLRAHSFADENAFVNGQKSGAIDTIAGWDVRSRMAVNADNAENQLYAFDGLRKHATVDSKTLDMNAKQDFDGAMELVNLLGIDSLMALDGQNDIVVGMSPEYFFRQAYKWTEFKTWDSVGALASLLSGTLGGSGPSLGLPNQVGYLFGRFPVVLMYGITPDLNASGVYDGVTTNLTGMVAFSLRRYQKWVRNGVLIETIVDAYNNTITAVSRQGRTIRRTGGSQPSAAWGYNLPTVFS